MAWLLGDLGVIALTMFRGMYGPGFLPSCLVIGVRHA